MRSLAHIINPFVIGTESDLHLAQRVTMKSMERAKSEASGKLNVDLVSAQYPEDREMIGHGWIMTPDLDRSMRDKGNFDRNMKLPFIRDILDRLYTLSEAEYLIFTNVDIGVQPNFYSRISKFIDEGYDAFIINRRRIPEVYSDVDELDRMYSAKGKKHPGFDCFVFHRDMYPKFSLADVCIGVPFIGITLAQNVFCHAKKPKVFTDEFLTFHIGMELFKKRASRDYFRYNRKEFWKAMEVIWDSLDTKKWPHGNSVMPWRMLLWGINPSLPIRLALKLEPRRWL